MSYIRDGHLLVFPIQKCGFLPKVKEIKRLCGGVVYYAAQASAQIDAEMGQKDHFWMETNYSIEGDRCDIGQMEWILGSLGKDIEKVALQNCRKRNVILPNIL